MKENDEILNTNIDTKIDKFKSEAPWSINKLLYPLNSNNYTPSYNQPSANIIKWLLLKSTDFRLHASQLTKHLSPMTLEGDTLLQLQKWWYTIRSALCKYLSTKNSCLTYKKIKPEQYDITKCLLPPDTHSKHVTEKGDSKHYQEHSEFILLKIPKYYHQNHQHQMSNSLQWNWIWTYFCICICHEYSIRSTCNQRSRPCDTHPPRLMRTYFGLLRRLSPLAVSVGVKSVVTN